MSSHETIAEIERELEENKRLYLRSHGWDVTYNTPGGDPLWVRDFAKEDEDREAHHSHAAPFTPYGVIMADMNLAIKMTVAALDAVPDADSDD